MPKFGRFATHEIVEQVLLISGTWTYCDSCLRGYRKPLFAELGVRGQRHQTLFLYSLQGLAYNIAIYHFSKLPKAVLFLAEALNLA